MLVSIQLNEFVLFVLSMYEIYQRFVDMWYEFSICNASGEGNALQTISIQYPKSAPAPIRHLPSLVGYMRFMKESK